MQALSVRDCLSFGWNTFKARPWLFIQAGLLLFLVNMGVSLLQTLFELDGQQAGPVVAMLTGIASAIMGIVISFFISMGETAFFLRSHEDVQGASIRDLWHPKPFWKFLGVSLISSILIISGFILLIVPGIFLAILFMFVGYLVIDTGLGPKQALKQSALMTKGSRWKLFGLSLALVGINILGLLALVVGLFVTIPVSFLAVTHAYRVLSKREASEKRIPEAITA